MTDTPQVPCNDCGTDDWTTVYTDGYSGVKASGSRSETEKEVFVCDGCGAEARRFTDGVDGSVTLSGALRGGEGRAI